MKTVSKKLISLLLVAIMLVAAMPVFALADAVTVEGPIDVTVAGGACDGSFKYGANLTNFDVTNTKALENVLVYGQYPAYDAANHVVKSGTLDEANKKLEIVVVQDTTYTVKVTGDATATGATKIAAPTESDFCKNYPAVLKALNDSGLGEYTNSDNWKLLTVTKDDTSRVVTVPVEKRVAPSSEPTTEPSTEPTTEPTTKPTEKPTEPTHTTYSGLKLIVNGKEDSSIAKDFIYDGEIKGDNAAAILAAAGITKDLSSYNVSAAAANGVVTITLTSKTVSNPDKVTVTVVNGSETKTYELEVGKYYYDYDFFTFANQDGRKFAALKITDTAGYERILDKDVKNDSAKVRSNDAKVTVQWNADTRKIEFMTDSTLSKVGTTRDVYYGARLDSVGGTLPTTVGGKTVEYWTVWGSRIYDNTEYKWNADKVQAVPHFAGESGKVYLEIYANGNRTSKYTQIDITYLLQDGVIYRDRLTSAIESAVKTKNVKITGLFEESDWSAYVRNVNNVTSKTSVQIGTNNADARYLYVMVNGVSTKTGDSTNPKTGDTAKLGVAAAVLAVAVVGFGAVTVITKKKGVQ